MKGLVVIMALLTGGMSAALIYQTGRAAEFQSLLNAHTGCMPEHEGENAALTRKGQIVECSITDGSGGRRHVVSRFSYEI